MKSTTINKYNIIGLMSGTSLDGIDVAFCRFEKVKNRWNYSIEVAQTFKYSPQWRTKLSNAPSLSGEKLIELHHEYGRFLGTLCNQFIKKHRLKKIDLIASHGHTIFHQPHNKFTFQIGDGNSIHAITSLPVVFDFRSVDVNLGGQGAPLVPIGDRFLFSEYDVCLNLGGIANLSMDIQRKRIAFDICYCNMMLNYLASKTGADFDKNGKLSSQGLVNRKLLNDFSKAYSSMRKKRPSLAREGFEKEIPPLIENETTEIADILRTACESIAIEVARAIPRSKKQLKLLVTGGGANNRFLIELIRGKLLGRAEVIVPDNITIDFKEALVFAFLGVLRLRSEANVLKSVTGASRNSCSGILIG